MLQIWMLSDEGLARYDLLKKLAHKTLKQCDGDADYQGDYNSSPCTSYRQAKEKVKLPE